MNISDWIKRRWMEFRTGYSTYLVFFLGFSNFLLILYNLAPSIKNYIEFTPFAVALFFVIIPVSVAIGYIHFKKQVPIETKVSAYLNPYNDKMMPKSKEEMNTQYSLFNLGHGIWGLNQSIWSLEHSKWNLENFNWNIKYAMWNAELTKKNMQLMNFLLKHFNAPNNILYAKEIEEIDKWIAESNQWLLGSIKWIKGLETWHKESQTRRAELELWCKRYKLFYEGHDATQVMKI